MTLQEIKQAIQQGKEVYYLSKELKVTLSKCKDYIIIKSKEGFKVELDIEKGTTLQVNPKEFYLA